MMDNPKDAPQRDYDFVRDTLVKMMSIRSGEHFQVITYSEDDGGVDDKRDYAFVMERPSLCSHAVRRTSTPRCRRKDSAGTIPLPSPERTLRSLVPNVPAPEQGTQAHRKQAR